jgi:hypothetical protein
VRGVPQIKRGEMVMVSVSMRCPESTVDWRAFVSVLVTVGSLGLEAKVKGTVAKLVKHARRERTLCLMSTVNFENQAD